jgi:hypothetical protein
MDFLTVMNRFVEGLEYIDQTHKTPQKGRKVAAYHPGVANMYETTVRNHLLEWWQNEKSSDLLNNSKIDKEHKYPDDLNKSCDLVLSGFDWHSQSEWEWAIEIKRIQFIGDNGNNNDYGVGKLLSPYRKDRSLANDIIKLQQSPIAKKKAVIAYVFNYSFETCDIAEKLHPSETKVTDALREVCKLNDPTSGIIDSKDLIEVVEFSLKQWGVNLNSVVKNFEAWTSPTGGRGVLFGWEV